MTAQETQEVGKGTGSEETAKPKIGSVMEAASALTRLGDEEEGSQPPAAPGTEEAAVTEEVKVENGADQETNKEAADEEDDVGEKKRYLPDHKKPDAAPTFPEKVRLLGRRAIDLGPWSCTVFIRGCKFPPPQRILFCRFSRRRIPTAVYARIDIFEEPCLGHDQQLKHIFSLFENLSSHVARFVFSNFY